MLRALAAFRTAVGMVMAGQLYEVSGAHRAAIETCAYAIFIGTDFASNADHIKLLLRRTAQVGIFVARSIDSLFPEFISSSDRPMLASLMSRY